MTPDVIRGSGFLVTANQSRADFDPVTGLPFLNGACWPSSWPTDGRDGGVPDPSTAGPMWVQIGTEGGVLPAPVLIPATPVGYNYNRRDVVVTNVQEHALFLGPAERADVIVDLTAIPDGSTLILYNDSPAPVPGFDTRLDYYTGDPDQSSTGGAPTTLPGYGPNIRTMMQIRVTGTGASAYNLLNLQRDLPGIFKNTQPPIIVPQKTYPAGSYASGILPAKNTYARIQDMTMTYTPVTPTGYGSAITLDLKPKAIHELFENDYGKMNSILAEEIPLTNFNNQTTIPLAYVDPPTDIVSDGETQLWKVTHNGVDSHAIHFHLFNVQLINRVGWDGAIRAPDPNELGWKETVRMNPLEDAFVALKPVKMALPTGFDFQGSNRLLDVTRAEHAFNTTGLPGFTNVDANGNPVTITNEYTDFGWEYVWHCHLLGHEESDMMRPLVFQVAVPIAPFNLTASFAGTTAVNLAWSYTQPPAPAPQATGFQIWRSVNGGAFAVLPAASALPLSPTTFQDLTVTAGTTYAYRVYASIGPALSSPSNTATLVSLAPPSNLRQAAIAAGNVTLSWTAPTSTAGETGYALSRCTGSNATCSAVGATWTTIATMGLTTTTFRNTGLVAPNQYTYRVQATGPGGTSSPFSNYLTVTAQ